MNIYVSGVTAGTGLVKDGNIINVNLGAGIKELPSDEVGIDYSTSGGLTLTSTDATGQLEIKKDVTTGATVAPINLSANGAGVKVDDSTMTHTAGVVSVKAAGITETELNSSVAGDGLAGGEGTALHVVVGNGIEINADAVRIKRDVATGSTVAPITTGANGAGVTIDDSSLSHASGTVGVKASGITGTHLNVSVAGAGLAGGGGSALAINTGDGIAIVSDAVAVDLASNCGLQITGGKLDSKLNTSAALAKDANGIGVVLASNPGLQFTGGLLDLKLEADKGLAKGANGLAVVVDGNAGMEVGSTGIGIKASIAGDALGYTNGVLDVKCLAGGGIVVDTDSIKVKTDVSTGATVAGVAISSAGVGVTLDNLSIVHTSGTLAVGDVDCGTF